MYFEILNRLGLDHDCDRQRDRPKERPLAIARSNMNKWVRRVLTKGVNSTVAIAINEREE